MIVDGNKARVVRLVRTYTRSGTRVVHSIHSILQGMTVWESGRESGLLDAIIAGQKTIEGRLNKGKFARYQPGDVVTLRRDYRDTDGTLRDGQPDAARVEIIAIRRYKSFLAMVTAEGYKKVIPLATNAAEAADEYNRYYSVEDQRHYGVLAIEVRPIT